MATEKQHWWKEPDATIHEKVIAEFKRIDEDQKARRSKLAHFMGLYENRSISSMDGDTWAKGQDDIIYEEDSKENFVKSIVDSAVAKISTNMPRLVQLTNGADHELQKKAKKRSLLLEGIIHDQKGYKLGRRIFHDACVFDEGMMLVYPDYDAKKPRFERVLDNEIVVDYLDGKYGAPRNMFRHKIASRSELIALYPDEEKEVMLLSANLIRRMDGQVKSVDDPVSVIEAWHLPSGKNKDDGKHVICVSHGCLVNEEHKRPRFPTAVMRWKYRSLGWHGMGLVEDTLNRQKCYTYMDQRINRILNNSSVRAAVEANSGVNVKDINNEDTTYTILEYSGNPPTFSSDPGPSPELFMERQRIKDSAYEQAGLSQLFAQGKKPAGLDAGVAIREVKDTESERFADVGQEWNDFWVDVGELTLDALEDLIKEHGKNFEIAVPTGGDIGSIKMSEIDMDREKYLLQTKSASLLPKEPAGRIATIQEMIGLFPEAKAFLASKLNNPDVEDAMSLISAPVDVIRMDIDKLDDGEQVTPEPFVDLQLASMLVLAAYNKARNHNADEKVLEAYRNYLISLQNMIEAKAQQAMAMQAAAMPPGPGAMPGPGPGPAAPMTELPGAPPAGMTPMAP